MAKVRSNEFVDFVRYSADQRYGSLEMKGNEVRSYGVLIATVDRDAKIVHYNTKKFSVTTSRHQNSVGAGMFMLPEYTLRFF